jgi:hypothetical protein
VDKVCIEQGDSRLARDFDNAASLEGVISLVVVSKSVNCMDMPYMTVLLTPKYETLKKKIICNSALHNNKSFITAATKSAPNNILEHNTQKKWPRIALLILTAKHLTKSKQFQHSS